MIEQKYILKNTESFEPKHIFECGQCFRWNKEDDGSYTGVTKNSVINVKKEENSIVFTGNSNAENFEYTIKEYFLFIVSQIECLTLPLGIIIEILTINTKKEIKDELHL